MGCNCKSKPKNSRPQTRVIPTRPNAPTNNGGRRIIKREIK